VNGCAKTASADQAAAELGITVHRLLERAGEGEINGAVLDRDGWRFARRAIERIREGMGA
jgi:hypothetical protein